MNSRKLTWIAMLIALSVVGASIKIPAPIGSIALDSVPSLLAAGLFGGPAGAAVGSVGHMISAMMSGMPLGPLHILIACEMAVLAYLYAMLYKAGKRGYAGILFVIGNSFAAPLPFMFLMGKPFYFAIVPSLFAGAILSTILTYLILPRISKALEHSMPFSRET